jgi:hypothetical protein
LTSKYTTPRLDRDVRGKNRSGISGKIILLIMIIAAAAGPVSVFLFLSLSPHTTDSLGMTGSLFLAAAGQASNGTGGSASYDAVLSVTAGGGTLNLTFREGNDVLTQHDYTVSNFLANDSTISMVLGRAPTVLVYVVKDYVWNGWFDNYFISSWGPGATASELRGRVSPSAFPGLTSRYYVELRLFPVQPRQSIPF